MADVSRNVLVDLVNFVKIRVVSRFRRWDVHMEDSSRGYTDAEVAEQLQAIQVHPSAAAEVMLWHFRRDSLFVAG